MSSIAVAVGYAPAALGNVGGTAEMEANLDLLIGESNRAYLESGVSQRLVLVAREEVNYMASGNPLLDLDRLTWASDGYMDELHELRAWVSVDLVDLIADLGGVYAAIADLLAPPASSALAM